MTERQTSTIAVALLTKHRARDHEYPLYLDNAGQYVALALTQLRYLDEYQAKPMLHFLCATHQLPLAQGIHAPRFHQP